ncbi:hypothetical protein D9756_005802 [Leucocoprinus leucothites]|uniref:Uncharacterized protein n=1 Tax=Leucocoprinus leucothites TaxID=201217 RepID=A0A8H5FWJ7_9AGAR|nr:hypothetical protein D9756_005802 [Leucoagaricus leucothites]
MFSFLQRASTFPVASRACLRVHDSVVARRTISVTSARWSTAAPEPPTPEEEAELEATRPEAVLESSQDPPVEGVKEERPREREPSYNEFLNTVGAQYKFAKPNNWLGGEVPFPMNPSFKPPPPLPDALRQQIYNEYMQDPVQNSVRILSQRYHLSLKRIDAILRLKGLEHSWYKMCSLRLWALFTLTNDFLYVLIDRRPSVVPYIARSMKKPIQYGFQRGMEKLLGVKSHNATETLQDGPRWDATEADNLEQDENRDAQRQRYQRHYWESVPEDGREPIVPAALEHAKKLAQRLVKYGEHQKSSHPRLMPRATDNNYFMASPKSQSEKDGRPVLEVRDVGGKFLNLNDSLKRIATAERRAREKGKKHERRKAAVLTAQS